jgi:exonuclease SbcC
MPSLAPELTRSSETLRFNLSELLHDRSPTIELLVAAEYPILLLETGNDLAGFAVADGHPREAYEASYAFFKDLYAERHKEWDNLNLSFILCPQRRDERLDDFFTRIEADTFFCRKFVIALDESLRRGLTRLPFAPLEHADGGFRRPPSAQTLLRDIGVPARLATYVVVPGQRDEEGIIDECKGGAFGAPQPLKEVGPSRSFRAVSIDESIRLKSLKIQNFRAYRKSQTFDLDADLIFLYGPNGFGKTSFFDAIDFVATGDIGRLKIKDRARLPKIARHLNSRSESSSVSAIVASSRGEREIERSTNSPIQSTIGNTEADRKHALLELVGPGATGIADRVENLIKLFRATHLFSQELQTLMEDFREHCHLSPDVVSRMLAFEDYVNGINKSGKVIDRLNRYSRAADTDIAAAIAALTKHRDDLDQLKSAATAAEDPAALLTLTTSAREKVHAVGIDLDDNEITNATARQWRALIEAKADATKSDLDRLVRIEVAQADITDLRRRIAADRGTINLRQRELSEAEQGLLESSNRLNAATTELNTLANVEKKSESLKRALEWQLRVKPELDNLQQQKITSTASVHAATSKLAEQESQFQNLQMALSNCQENLSLANRQRTDHKQILEVVARLVTSFPLWIQQNQRKRELEQAVAADERQSLELEEAVQHNIAEMQEAAALARRSFLAVEQMREKQTQLQQLIAQIETHVGGPTCPVCGVDHGSVEKLIERIHEQQAEIGIAPSNVVRDFEAASARAQSLAAALDELKRRQQELRAKIRAANAEIDGINEKVRTFEVDAKMIDLPLSEDALLELERRTSTMARRDADLQRVTSEFTETEATISKQLNGVRLELQNQREQLEERNRDLKRVSESLNELLAQRPADAFPLESTAAELTAALKDIEAQLVASKSSLVTKRSESAALTVTVETADKRVNSLKQQVATVREALARAQELLSGYEQDLRLANLPVDANATMVAELKKQKSGYLDSLSKLVEQVSSLEVALDAITTAAALRAKIIETKTLEEKIRASTAERETSARWRAYFEHLRDAMQKEQNRAVKEFTYAYGPLTTTIQRRLRSVYGFEDVILDPRDDEIAIRVMKNGEQLRPTDYFSQSQQQILMLSLFLTACITQTWSSFGPILLDDPITHFDDLNAYSFLDLIAGLTVGEQGRHQFIVSTCEERLFQLVRQKFSNFGRRIRIYRFVSTGIEGPVIEAVSL